MVKRQTGMVIVQFFQENKTQDFYCHKSQVFQIFKYNIGLKSTRDSIYLNVSPSYLVTAQSHSIINQFRNTSTNTQ